MKKRMLDVLMLVIGAFFFALAVNLFAIPNDLGEGGVTGITLILYTICFNGLLVSRTLS